MQVKTTMSSNTDLHKYKKGELYTVKPVTRSEYLVIDNEKEIICLWDCNFIYIWDCEVTSE